MPNNLLFGWTWILLGFLSGMVIGLRFQREDWLGGYASHRRRMVRLGHISFFGLGFLNVLFALVAPQLALATGRLRLASLAFLVGGVSMPLCCALMAWRRAAQPMFAVPVTALLAGAALVVMGLLGR